MIKRFSIRRKLIVAFILVGVFPMLIATYIGVKIASVRLEKGIEDRISYAGKSAVYLLDQKKNELESVAHSFSEDPRLRQVIQGEVNIKFLWFDTPLQVFLFNESGLVFSSTEEVFSRPQHPEKGMTLLHTKTQSKSWPLLVYLFPVSDQEKLIGTIMTGYTLNQDFLNDLKQVTGVESMLFQLAPSGDYLSLGEEKRLDVEKNLFQKVAVKRHQVYTKVFSTDAGGEREEYFALLTPLPDAEGSVSYMLFNGIPISETLSGKLASARFYYILIAVGLLLSVLVGSVVATGISWPILRFSEGVRAISAGDYNQKIQLKSRDEIGELAQSFNLMTDRLQETIAKLVENQNYTENILRSLLNGVVTIGADYNIVRINRAAETIFCLQVDQILGKNISVFFEKDPEILSMIRECIEHHQVKEGVETLLHRKDGSTIPIELSLSPLQDPNEPSGMIAGSVLLIRDLTEIQALKEHIRRQDRLAALGELSAGIAHEIRNPLGIIKGAAGILKKGSVQKDPKFIELSSVILEEVDRLNEVINDFLEFARPMPPMMRSQNINDLLDATLQMVKMQFEEKKVQTQKVLAPDLPPVMVDEHQMHQVFLNLILNALHATEEEDTVKITTRFFHEDNQVEIIFADTGMGIPEKNLKKVFNPFFTTKQGGTGLGLSVVSKIIMNHNGKIFLRSEEGKGALFTIILPAAEKFEKVGS